MEDGIRTPWYTCFGRVLISAAEDQNADEKPFKKDIGTLGYHISRTFRHNLIHTSPSCFEAEVRYAPLKVIDGITFTKLARKLIDSLDSEPWPRLNISLLQTVQHHLQRVGQGASAT